MVVVWGWGWIEVGRWSNVCIVWFPLLLLLEVSASLKLEINPFK